MTQMNARTAELEKKYGAKAIAAGRRQQPKSFEQQLAIRDAFDQYFARLRVDYATLGILERQVLDQRTRFLAQIGQFTMVRNEQLLEDAIHGAIGAGVRAREVLEIILQCAVYGGDNAVVPALNVFARAAQELGLHEELKKDQLPLDGHDRDRSLEAERKEWHPEDVTDPRREEQIAKHGWLAVSTGLRMRPKHHLNILSYLDALDSEFADLWVKFCYQGMYSRWIVDDKTRLLCMVADCLAVGEMTQGRAHMRGAMRQGATPREVMELVFLTTVNFGMPQMGRALKVFVELIAAEGRLAEIGNPPPPVE